MQLIKRTTLHFQEATSDKIYEVDLCQTGDNRYVVNFRYGRRGATLKEGVKTTQAVPLAEAEKVFDKLVAEKVKKGYQDVSTPTVRETVAPKKVRTPNRAARNQAILTRLANREPSKWPLERAIWRAGELKITEATPLLIELLGSGDALRDYCIAWALGWCGGKGAVAALIQLYSNNKTPEFVSRIAFEALLKLADPETKAGLHSEMIEQLPTELRQLASSGTPENFSNALRDYLNSSDYKRFAVLDTIYQIDNESVRPALSDILKTAPFRPNYFQRLRHIFKIAEYRLDAEVFAILAYRLEKEKAMYGSDSYGVHPLGGGYLRKRAYNYNPATRSYEEGGNEIAAELKRSESRIAYSSNTRKYLLRRVWRSLKTLGELGDTEYVKMAVNILLQYSDADARQARQTTIYRWDRTNWTRISFTRNWDAYAGYLTFNHILYENSPRYELKQNSKGWRCREPYKPGDPEPDVREEAFPQLWEQQPAELLRLLLESNCRPVHHFAAKALGACPQFCAELEATTVITLLNKPYEATVKLGFEVARHLYNPNEPDISLVLAVVNCTLSQARAEGYRWIEAGSDRFLSNNNFIAALVTSPQPETRQFTRQFLSAVTLSDNRAKVILGQIFAELLGLDVTQGETAKDIAETLFTCFASQLRTLGFSIVRDLLQHPLVEIQEFGARILLNHQTNTADFPPGLIDLLMTSPHDSIRAIGIQIFGNLPDATLLNQYSFLVTLATHELPEIRSAIRPAIRRLATNHPDFAARFIAELIHILTQPEAKEGIHASIVLQLKEDLPNWMNAVTKDTALQMLKAKSSATQELAGHIISANRDNWANEFETFEIVKLADNEILSVREAAREIFLHNLNRLRGNEQEMLAAVKLVECKWDDTREFGFRVFGTFFTDADLTPSILVNLCDSVREDVRKFGRDMVTRYFKEVYGQEYLLKFSEHPSTDMQLFATNYLESYAINNPERLQELMPYFITVLSQVNRGRVAKQRIFAFLDKEAQKSEEAARVVAEILTRQSATMAIGNKAAAIETMVKIHKTYPHLELPIQVKPVSPIRE